MYEKPLDEVQISFFGLTKLDMPDEDVLVFPDCWEAFTVFDVLSTQWRVGMGGPVGLDYNTIPLAMKSLGYKKKMLPDILADIRIMEMQAMRQMHENNNEK